MKSLEYLDKILSKNARYSAAKHIYEYIKNNKSKRFIEFGTSRVNFEGNSTIFLSLLAKENGAKFTSVDISQQNIDNAIKIVENFDKNLLQYIEFVCMDQYEYMKKYDEESAQYVYLDCDDQHKHNSLKSLLESNILDYNSLICIDDMITQDYGCIVEVDGVVDIVNSNPEYLKPLDRIDYGETINSEQMEWNKKNKILPKIEDNFLVHEKGVKQFEYQILVECKK